MSYWKWVLISCLLLVIGIVVGIIDPAFLRLPPEYIAGLRELGRILVPSSILTLLIIFLKNVTAMLISFIFSPLFCITPLLSLLSNGWLIGYVSTDVMKEASIGYLLAGILPHGIFEIPALIMAQAASLSFGVHIIVPIIRKKKRKELVKNIKRDVKYLLIALILLVPAAIIETYVTHLLLK
jgi:stage II sporulation protein M